MSRDDYLTLVHDLTRKRDTLNAAISGLWAAIESGALSDPMDLPAPSVTHATGTFTAAQLVTTIASPEIIRYCHVSTPSAQPGDGKSGAAGE